MCYASQILSWQESKDDRKRKAVSHRSTFSGGGRGADGVGRMGRRGGVGGAAGGAVGDGIPGAAHGTRGAEAPQRQAGGGHGAAARSKARALEQQQLRAGVPRSREDKPRSPAGRRRQGAPVGKRWQVETQMQNRNSRQDTERKRSEAEAYHNDRGSSNNTVL